jgi:hypothetical protein
MVSALAVPQLGQVIVDSKIISASRIQVAKYRQDRTEREDTHQ